MRAWAMRAEIRNMGADVNAWLGIGPQMKVWADMKADTRAKMKARADMAEIQIWAQVRAANTTTMMNTVFVATSTGVTNIGLSTTTAKVELCTDFRQDRKLGREPIHMYVFIFA